MFLGGENPKAQRESPRSVNPKADQQLKSPRIQLHILKGKKMTLYRPVNQAELDLIKETNWKAFPSRLEGQPIFYPVTNERYANEITEQWNVPAYGVGYVVKFDVEGDFTSRYEIKTVGLDHHTELWILAEDMETMNANIIGVIELISIFE